MDSIGLDPSSGSDWSGGSGYFSTLGGVSQIPDSSPASSTDGGPAVGASAPPSWWDSFWAAVGIGLPGMPNLSAVGPATDALGTATVNVANAVPGAISSAASSLKSFGLWLLLGLGLLAVIFVAWKV